MPTDNQLLLVEDDDLVARSLTRMLRVSGFHVVRHSSCRAVSDYVRRQQDQGLGVPSFEVGVFDIDLGDGDGVTLADSMQRQGLVNRVVFFTATADNELHEQASRMGPVIRKTEGTEALLSELRRAPTSGIAQRVTTPATGSDVQAEPDDAERHQTVRRTIAPPLDGPDVAAPIASVVSNAS